MVFFDRLARSFSYLTLPAVRAAYEDAVRYSGEKKEAYYYLGLANVLGFLLFVSCCSLLLSPLASDVMRQLIIFGSSLAISMLPLLLFYFYFFFRAERRSSLVEQNLPDVLHMIAANLRSGMTPFEAVKVACTHDFGPVTDELRSVTTKSHGLVSFSDLLTSTSRNIRSDSFSHSMNLFASSLRSGGHVAELLDGLAQDIVDRQSLRKELIINTATNAMFIMFTIVIGTPVLLAISIYFVDVVGSLQSGDSSSTVQQFGLAGLGGEISITSSFLTVVSYIMLFVTGILATMFIGSMIDGDPKKGLKWAPLLVAGSFLIFFVARVLIKLFLGNPLT